MTSEQLYLYETLNWKAATASHGAEQLSVSATVLNSVSHTMNQIQA